MAEEIELGTVEGEAIRETTSIGEEHVAASSSSSPVRVVVARSETVDGDEGGKRKEDPPPYSGSPEAEEAGGSSSNARRSSFSIPKMEVNKGFLKWFLIGVGVVVGVALLLVVILVPISFADLNYYEMGFVQQKSTGRVDTTEVYEAGRHFVTADFTFRVFPRDSHFVTFTDLFVFAAPSEATQAQEGRSSFEMTIDVSFQYFIRPSELASLHSEYELQYSSIIVSAAESAIKSQNQFTPEQFIFNRSLIESTMLGAVQERLGGLGCCDSYCSDSRFTDYPTIAGINCTGCPDVCPNQTLHVDVRYFQLKQITLPSELRASFLAQIIEAEDAQTEMFVQDLAVVNAEIQREVRAIENEAERVNEQANADSALIGRQAQANASATVENARSEGLAMLYGSLNITETEHKASFDYLRTLLRKRNLRLHVGFSSAVAGPFRT